MSEKQLKKTMAIDFIQILICIVLGLLLIFVKMSNWLNILITIAIWVNAGISISRLIWFIFKVNTEKNNGTNK